jgi:hypothetical protein
MSLDNALETARKILEEESHTDPTKLTAMRAARKATEMSEKMKKHSSGGEGEEVSDVPGMKGSEISADGTTPKVPEPVTGGTEPVDDLSDMEPEEEMYGSEEDMHGDEEEDMHGDDEEEMMNMDDDKKKKMMMMLKKMMSGGGMGGGMKGMSEGSDYLGKLFSGEELSEEFKDKASTIFEAAVEMKVDDIRAELHEEFAQKLELQVESMAEKMDDYLSYVVENWMKENQVAIDTGVRSDVTESFMVGLKKLFETHYVTMPEESYDLVEGLNNKVFDLNSQLDEQIKKNISIMKQMTQAQAEAVYESHTKGLTETQEARMRQLAEKIDFDDAQEFAEKLDMLKENFFDVHEEEEVSNRTPLVEEFAITEEEAVDQERPTLAPTMEAYTNALSRSAKIERNNTYSK